MDKNSVLMFLDGKISTEHKFMLNSRLDNVSEEKLQNLSLVPLKSPILAIVLGFFFGWLGVDRFYQGSYGLGILKIALLLIGWITTLIAIGFLILWALGVYVFVDLFFVYKAVQRDNFKKISQAIE